MTTPLPTVGRIVHYVARGSADGEFSPACRAAVVTEVYARGPAETAVGLAVLNPSGLFFDRYVPRDEGHPNDPAITEKVEPVLCDGLVHRGGTWHYPARVGG